MSNLSDTQRRFFSQGSTLSLDFREAQLKRLFAAVREREPQILQALHADLGKSDTEGFIGEVAFTYEELRHTLAHFRKWARPTRVPTPWLLAVSSSRIYFEPLGTVLIISPWNYPFQLCLSPLIGALAAGNCAVLKPSELAPATAAVLSSLVRDTFDPNYVSCVEGGVDVSQALLAQRWDYIFYTGSTAVGKVVMAAAAQHLTPVTLELGGKSPCVLDDSANLKLSLKRIAWGKYFNAGQTCVAPDYLLVPRAKQAQVVTGLAEAVRGFFGDDPQKSPDYARIINHRHFDRLESYLTGGKIVSGGTRDRASRYFAPSVLQDVAPDSPLMQEEIFGPLLPVLPYDTLEEAIAFVKARPKPLAFYYFASDRTREAQVLSQVPFGGGCVNDTLMHLSNPHLPFGGVGPSGMGGYHGKFSFETFSHRKSLLRRSFWIDPTVRYPPYGNKLSLLRRILG